MARAWRAADDIEAEMRGRVVERKKSAAHCFAGDDDSWVSSFCFDAFSTADTVYAICVN